MVQTGGGGWKRIAFGGNKKVCAKDNLLVCENGNFFGQRRKACAKEAFVRKNGFE
ncbi:MAG: hypothetical protein ACOYIO_09860 [Eubacteriales bacterium]